MIPDGNSNTDPPLPSYFFIPSCFYYDKTICAPCGVVIGLTKFDGSESPTNILNFLGSVYPTEESQPDYICIDKTCQVLATAVANGSWEIWKRTSWFLVDSYHYTSKHFLCHKYCNPAPKNGQAPNLVIVEHDENGRPAVHRALTLRYILTFYPLLQLTR